jgi:hypothetical protein
MHQVQQIISAQEKPYDVIVCVETKVIPKGLKRGLSAAARVSSKDCGDLVLPGYHHVGVSRRGKLGGGVSIFTSDQWRGQVTEVARSDTPTGCESVWLRVHRCLANHTKNLLIGGCYCSPASSPVYADTRACKGDLANAVFGQIGGILAAVRCESDEVLITGDFNARIGAAGENGERTVSPFELPTDESGHTLPPRQASDMTTNAFGKRMLALCSQEELYILNGRTEGDIPDAHSQRMGQARST